MEALVALILFLLVLVVAVYALAAVIMVVGAAGWYLSFPILGVLTALMIAWPIIDYQRRKKRLMAGARFFPARWVGSFWAEEDVKIIFGGLALLIVWGCALRDQISTLWDSISPYVLR